MKKSEVTERIKELMPEADRQALFGAPLSVVSHDYQHESRDYLTKLEKQDHIDLENQLNQWELFYRHARMDKATTEAKGLPDFIIGICGRMVCIEFKRPGKKLTAAQEEWRRRAHEKSKVAYHVFDNSGDAIRMLSEMRRLLSGNT